MKILESILQHLLLGVTEKETSKPEGLCPNCWGHTEYGGKFYTKLENESPYGNKSKSGWIQNYADKYFT